MFFDREQEQQELRRIIEMEPALVYFVYGPINSGKTSLITTVLNDLAEPCIPFYINLRGRNVNSSEDFLNVLFTVDRKSQLDTAKEYVKELLKGGGDVLKEMIGIPIPSKIFDLLFQTNDKGADVFLYLERFFGMLVREQKRRPILVLDELQMLKGVVNGKGNLLVDSLFNFFVRLTKETHLCHCFALSSDSVFMQYVYGQARLRGRAAYFGVDDLDQARALTLYAVFDFPEKDQVWDVIGGKIGDMIVLRSMLHEGRSLAQALEAMIHYEVSSLRMIAGRLGEQSGPQPAPLKLLEQISSAGQLAYQPETMRSSVEFWVDQNVLFLDPMTNMVHAQGQLLHRAIQTFMQNA